MKPIRGFTKAAMEKLLDHTWPGNVRELEHCIHRSLLLCDDEVIRACHVILDTFLLEARHGMGGRGMVTQTAEAR